MLGSTLVSPFTALPLLQGSCNSSPGKSYLLPVPPLTRPIPSPPVARMIALKLRSDPATLKPEGWHRLPSAPHANPNALAWHQALCLLLFSLLTALVPSPHNKPHTLSLPSLSTACSPSSSNTLSPLLPVKFCTSFKAKLKATSSEKLSLNKPTCAALCPSNPTSHSLNQAKAVVFT